MNKAWLIIVLVCGIGVIFYFKAEHKMIYKVNNVHDLIELFPKTPAQIKHNVDKCMQDIECHITKILEVSGDRNFDNTAKALDAISYFFGPVNATLTALELLSPDKNLREAAHEGILKLSSFLVDKVSTNVELYKAFKNYVENNADKENLDVIQKYYLQETMADYKRSGLDLPEDKLKQVRSLAKDLAALSIDFEANIAQHKCKLVVNEAELDGVPKNFIENLKKTEAGEYILGCDYPTYFTIIDNCKVESTRKKLYKEFQNRAYPKNMDVLNNIISKRDELAKLVGYSNFASLTLDNQMAKTPQQVEKFLNNLLDKSLVKAKHELKTLKLDLPESVTLTNSNKIKSWDLAFVKNFYKKKYLNIDEQKVAEYFPMEHTVKQLLDIYEKFLGLKFTEVDSNKFWHTDVKLVEAYDSSNNKLLGYLLLDLYPRDNKFSHAANLTVVPCVMDNMNNNKNLSVSIVMANFPKPTKTEPSLLKFKDVKTFFHEFGHAMHVMLGCTSLYSFSGTNVKRDFVELPSQMLEDWLHDKEILKLVSKHYITGEPLDNSLIDTLIKLEKFDSGLHTLQQIYYSLISLEFFKNGSGQDTQSIAKEMFTKVMSDFEWNPDNHMQASFGHLTDYGPSYYGYLWSLVYAKDLFHEITKVGLLNPEIGKKYIQEVIGKGGSYDPNTLLRNFLGREPNEQAFLKDLGLI